MAQYRYNQTLIQRSKGHSVVGKAAYNSREILKDERLGRTFHYKNIKEDFIHSEIYAPHRVGQWARDRQTLMNKVDAAELKKNSITGLSIGLALPRELTDQQNIELVKDFAQKAYVSKGIIVDTAIHKSIAKDGGDNPHAHIILTTRKLDGDGFNKKKAESWSKKGQLHRWRKLWADVQNEHLEKHGFDVRVDHRTLEEQGEERIPTVHEGKKITALKKKGITHDIDGQKYDRMDENIFIHHDNVCNDFNNHADFEPLALPSEPKSQPQPKKQAKLAFQPGEDDLQKHARIIADFEQKSILPSSRTFERIRLYAQNLKAKTMEFARNIEKTVKQSFADKFANQKEKQHVSPTVGR